MNNQKKIAIIIGGSGSLGESIARQFASQDYNLLLTGRNLEKLDTVSQNIQMNYPNISVENIYFNYNDDKSYIPFIKKIESINRNVSILINTAAGFYKGDFTSMSINQIETLIQSNFIGFIKVFHGIINKFLGNNMIDIINITSYSSATNLDTSKSSALHITTKSALQIFDTTIGNELLASNIRITTVAPSTFSKKGRIGLPLTDIAKLIWLIHIIPSSIKVDTIVASYTGN